MLASRFAGLPTLARHTQTFPSATRLRTRLRPGKLAEGKGAIASQEDKKYMPERHACFWLGIVAQSKNVSVCLRGSVAKTMHNVSGQVPVDGALHLASIDSQIKVFC